MADLKPGDLKTEVHFIGQIVGASDFQMNTGLFCEAHLEYGEYWRELPGPIEGSIQTQTAYPDTDDFVVWAHPLDLHFATDSIFGWPKLQLRIWRLDDVGRIDLISYAITSLPCGAGYYEIICPTWRPLGSWQDEAMAFFVGGPPRLTTEDALSKDLEKRPIIKTVSSGTVHIQLEVILRNFEKHATRGHSMPIKHSGN